MRRLNNYLPVCFLLLVAMACKKQASQASEATYYAEVLVRFLAPENEYKTQISFFKGSSMQHALPVRAKNQVLFQQNPMEARTIEGYTARYEKLQAGPYQADHIFSFVLDDEQQRALTIHMEPLANYTVENYSEGGTFFKTKGATLLLKDSPLQEAEQLLVLFTDDAGNTFSIQKKGPSATRIPLTPLDLADIPAGSYELYLVKKQERIQQQKQLTVLSTIEYYSRISRLNIRD